MSIQDDPNRVVRTANSTIAFIGHNEQVNEDVLLECFVDKQTNIVTWKATSKARKGVDFVEANESIQPLLDWWKENFPNPITTEPPPPTEEDVITGNEGNNPVITDPVIELPQWQKEINPETGQIFTSKAEWRKAHHKE
jgi:hypothetical protein